MTPLQLENILNGAESSIIAGNFTEAEALCRHALMENPAPMLHDSEASAEPIECILHARTLRLLTAALIYSGKAAEARMYAEEAIAYAAQSNDEVEIAKAAAGCGAVYLVLAENTLALEYLGKALPTFEALGMKLEVAKVTGNIGSVYSVIADFGRSLEYFSKSLAALEELGMETEAAKVVGNIGIIHMYMSDYSRAIHYMSTALAIHEKFDMKADIARVMANIATVYWNLADYSLSLQYHSKALAVYEALGNLFGVAQVTGNIGNVYWTLTDYPRALEYYIRALALNEELGTEAESAHITLNIGNVYHALNDYARAMKYYERALAFYEKADMKADIALATGNIGELYSYTNYEGYDPRKAEEFLLKAIAVNTDLGAKQSLYENHRAISALYKAEKKWEEFAVHIETYHHLKHEVQSEEATRHAQRFATEREVALIQREQEILREKNAELEKLNAQLRELNEEKNEFLGIASHDLKNPLNSIAILANLLEKETSTLTQEEIKEFAGDIRISSKRMFDLIKDLLDINRIEQGFALSDTMVFASSDYIRSCIELHRAAASAKSITIISDVASVDILSSPSTFLQVLDNLLSNAIKFSPSNTAVTVHSEVTDTMLRISVQDQGPGLTPNDLGKLFGKFMRLSARPTGGEHSTGLGLSIVKKLVEAMHGSIRCESEAGKGATFIVELPLLMA
ncbi:MAG: tetratricopeptide repeat-containing sensor histidine kinase [Candidatus Kapaibacterium sp.]